jgi:hypothetical protein
LNETIATIIILAAGTVIFLLLYVFSTFTCRISENSVVMQWHVLKCVPFASRKIGIEDIQEAREFEFRRDMLRGAVIFGNLFVKKGVIITLKPRSWRLQFTERIFVTPENPDTFIEEVNDNVRKYTISESQRE